MDKALLEQLGMNTAQGAINTALGMATANWNDERQIKQQKRLNELGLQMWKDTNYTAQRKEIEKAGLNVGLLYGIGGGGGATVGNQGTAPSGGGELGMGIMTKKQLELLEAQIQNVKADTSLKQQGIPKTQQDTETGQAQEANIQADTINKQLTNRLLQIQESVQTQTLAESVQQIQAAAKEAMAKAAVAEGNKDALIEQAQIATYQAILNTALTKAQISNTKSDTAKNQAQIKEIAKRMWKIGVDAAQKGQELDQNAQRIAIENELKDLEKQMTDFKTSTPEQIKQWSGLTKEVVQTITELQKLIPVAKGMKPYNPY